VELAKAKAGSSLIILHVCECLYVCYCRPLDLDTAYNFYSCSSFAHVTTFWQTNPKWEWYSIYKKEYLKKYSLVEDCR
jgi:hypothetical protein